MKAAVAITFGLVLLAHSGCEKQKARLAETRAPVHVQIRAAERKKTISYEEAVGTVRAKLQATIEAKVSARIERMLAEPGREIKTGDLLVQLDSASRLRTGVPQNVIRAVKRHHAVHPGKIVPTFVEDQERRSGL
jgi:multidrug efflux pump subunit AcrA (membrane-fusion protein)